MARQDPVSTPIFDQLLREMTEGNQSPTPPAEPELTERSPSATPPRRRHRAD